MYTIIKWSTSEIGTEIVKLIRTNNKKVIEMH